MAFHDVRLPVDVERGAQGGPRFKTTILTLTSGHERRNIDWQGSRGEWDVGYGVTSREALVAVRDFFYARRGRAHSFRFKDWSDFEIGDVSAGAPQTIGVGDGLEHDFQAVKTYQSGSETHQREVTKLVAGTVKVYLDGSLQSGGYSVDLLTGVVSFVSAPGEGVLVGLACEFDVPVRFDTDALDINMELFSAGSVPNIPVVEVRGE